MTSQPTSGPVAQITPPGRAAVLGIVNVTPDSFSDGGRWLDLDVAVQRGHQLVADGADIVDVGGESTRPGAQRVPEDVELARVVPVVRELAAAGIVVSVDTMRGSVAHAVLGAGATIVNDVSGGLADPTLLSVVAEAGAPVILMHWRGHADVMDTRDTYHDVVRDVAAELSARVDAFVAAGGNPDQVIVDPGLGFAKTGASNWPVLTGLSELVAVGFPVLVGASRKRFLGDLLAADRGNPAGPTDRDAATAAVSALAAAAGAWGVRVHEPRANRDAVVVAAQWMAGRGR